MWKPILITAVGWWLTANLAAAQVSVSASVDQARVGLGESIALTIRVQGSQQTPQPAIPKIEGLDIAGPSVNTSVSIVNGAMSQSVSLVYQVTPTRVGEFIIPALEVALGGKVYRTEPIPLTVEKTARADLADVLFIRLQLNSQTIYVGETAPLNVLVFARANLPVRGLSSFNADAEGLDYKYLGNVRTGTQTIHGEAFNVYLIEGAISPTRPGRFTFGPAIVKVQLTGPRRGGGNSLFDEMFGRTEVREVPVTLDAVPIEVVPLPAEGRPADFAGAVGQWQLSVDAKPTSVAVGDPITVTIKVSGTGNLDTVPPIRLPGLEAFKTYEPTQKSSKNELGTSGERIFQQVLIAKDTTATNLPALRLPYFDPVARAYRVAEHAAIPLQIKAGGQAAVLAGETKVRAREKLGADIVYLKGQRGPPPRGPLPAWLFWLLNLAPVAGLTGVVAWRRRQAKLAGNVAYARRRRAARVARHGLATATTVEELQRVLQEYLGDRLNIPASGITAAVADEHRLPAAVREIFEACDAARFAGARAEVAVLKPRLEQVIDELENDPR
jgi:hypothetical protein